ncbi:MAG: peptidoglycan-associated lipoprotein Pal, partial [Vicinamibacteria bacterium]
PPPPPARTPAEDYRDANVEQLQRNLNDAYYDYDQADLREDARATLAKNADWLKLPYVTAIILVEGHCDERGTEGYNLALGERRARAAMEYLQSLGVPANRLKMVSYGKERPQCTEANDDCWQRNRRAHLRIDAK